MHRACGDRQLQRLKTPYFVFICTPPTKNVGVTPSNMKLLLKSGKNNIYFPHKLADIFANNVTC